MKIIDLAKENDIELCFFLAPYAVEEKHQKLINHAKQIAEAQNIPVVDFVDLAEEIKLDADTDFLDYGHTNHSGAQKISKYLGDYIASNYDLEDHRGDERYALWDDNSVLRNHEEQNWDLRFITEIDAYLENVMQLEDYLVVVSTLGNHLSETEDVYSVLAEYGIGGEFYSGGGIWVYESGELTYSITEENALKHIDLGLNDMLLSRASGVNSIMVNKSIFQKPIDGINILVYDRKLGAVADCIGFSAPHDYGVYR